MRVSYLGNFGPSHSTETHIAASLEALGHEVIRVQEGSMPALDVGRITKIEAPDLFLWTQTLSLAEQMGNRADRLAMLRLIETVCPTAGFHLDRWWGLSRETRVRVEPFFRVNHLFTADGGHEEEWKSQGINHHWLPPGVYHEEAHDGTPREEFTARVAFVGSWQGYGHKEHAPARQAMIAGLEARYKNDFRAFPYLGQPRVVYPDLNDLYASVEVVVGDSCLSPASNGEPIGYYWSDRIPETTGRGGLLVHPYVHGLPQYHPSLPVWDLGDLETLYHAVDQFLDDPTGRELARMQVADETRENNTYKVRMERLLYEIFPDLYGSVTPTLVDFKED